MYTNKMADKEHEDMEEDMEEQPQQALHVESIANGSEGVQVVLNTQGLVHTEMVDGTQVSVVEAGVGEDILQQALEEAAAGGFDVENATVEYRTENGAGHQFVTVSDGLNLGDGNTYTIVNNANGEQVLAPYTGTIDEENQVGLTQLVNVSDDGATSFGSQHIHEIVELPQQQGSIPVQLEIPEDTIIEPTNLETEQQTATAPLLNVDTNAPLGSSDNPIRIVQQGNQYTSVQQLTPEQLTHIMQVLQQQQVAKSTQQAGSSTLFNPQTNTKIVYRVIYPSDLHKSSGGTQTSTAIGSKTILSNRHQLIGSGRGRGRGRPRKNPLPEEDDKLDVPDLSREEKAAKKKQRPRTRSGRVSKPPKHMVKDYKHIHLLDWEEDYDDDDGGYSDYKASDVEEGENYNAEMDQDHLLDATRPRNNVCQTCNKGYIGPAGLARHYRLYPNHGSAEELAAAVARSAETNGMVASPSSSTSSVTTPFQEMKRTNTSVPSTSGDGPSVPESNPSSPVPVNPPTEVVKRRPGRPPKSATKAKIRAQNLQRARQVYLESKPKRKVNLKEFIKQCEDEELMEVVLPRLAKAVTLWEFLMMKSEKGRPLKPCIPDIVQEYETLQKQVRKVCQEYLKPSAEDADHLSPGEENPSKMKLTNEDVAKSLGLSIGSYDVMEIPTDGDTPFQYKYLTTDANVAAIPEMNTSGKRTIQIVEPEDLVENRPSKRIHLQSDENETPVSYVQGMSSTTSSIVNHADVISPKGQSVPAVGNGVNLNTKVPTPRVQVVRPQADNADKPAVVKIVQSSTNQFQVESADQVNTMVKPMKVKPEPGTEKVLVSPERETALSVATATCKTETTVTATVAENSGSAGSSLNNSEQYEISVTLLDTPASTTESEPVVSNIKSESTGNEVDSKVLAAEEGETVLPSIQAPEEEEEQVLIQVQDEQPAADSNQIQIFQTPEGVILVQKPDGTMLQIQHPAGEAIPLETVQALLAMDGQGALDPVDESQVVEQ